MGVIVEEEVEAPVRARPEGPSAMRDEEADAYPEGRTAEEGVVVDPPVEPPVDPPVEVTVMTPLKRVARAVLSENKMRRKRIEVSASFFFPLRSSETRDSQAIERPSPAPQVTVLSPAQGVGVLAVEVESEAPFEKELPQKLDEEGERDESQLVVEVESNEETCSTYHCEAYSVPEIANPALVQ